MTVWTFEGNRILCRWSEVGANIAYASRWMEGTEMSGSFLPPVPDFASHSPFGGATWFAPQSTTLPNSN